MSNAWETTVQDIAVVLEGHGVSVSNDIDESCLEEILSELDHELIEASALYGNDIDEQIKFAYEEIASQLKKSGVL